MTKYLFIYHAPMTPAEAAPPTPEQMEAVMGEWNAWAGRVGSGMVDFGTPLAGGIRVTTGRHLAEHPRGRRLPHHRGRRLGRRPRRSPATPAPEHARRLRDRGPRGAGHPRHVAPEEIVVTVPRPTGTRAIGRLLSREAVDRRRQVDRQHRPRTGQARPHRGPPATDRPWTRTTRRSSSPSGKPPRSGGLPRLLCLQPGDGCHWRDAHAGSARVLVRGRPVPVGRGLRPARQESESGVALGQAAPLRGACGHPQRRHGGKEDAAVLLLPSLRSAPLDSPELLRIVPRPTPRLQPTLLPWTVPVVSIDAASAFTVFDDTVKDSRSGASVAYFAELAGYARELVARGRVVPALELDGLEASARWRPALRGPDVVAVTRWSPRCRRCAAPDRPRTTPTTWPTRCTRWSTPQLEQRCAPASTWCRRGAAAVRCACPPSRRGWRRSRHPTAGSTAPTTRPRARARAAAVGGDRHRPDRPGSGHLPSQRGRLARRTPRRPRGIRQTGGWSSCCSPWQDPSLLVPAAQAWSDDGSLRRWLDRPHELLLAELGRASRIYPSWPRACGRPARARSISTPTGAYDFLSIVAPALDEAGFGVLLPSWWDRRARLGLGLSRARRSTGWWPGPADSVASR